MPSKQHKRVRKPKTLPPKKTPCQKVLERMKDLESRIYNTKIPAKDRRESEVRLNRLKLQYHF